MMPQRSPPDRRRCRHRVGMYRSEPCLVKSFFRSTGTVAAKLYFLPTIESSTSPGGSVLVDQARGTSQEFPDEIRDLPRRLFQVLPTASDRRERPVTSTPPGGSALLIVSLLAVNVITHRKHNWSRPHRLGRHRLLPSPTPSLPSPTAPPSSNNLPSSHFQDKLSVGVE